MDFKEFFYQNQTSFEYEGITILIEEVPLQEAAILGLNAGNQGDKRFKVTFKAPKNRTDARLGHYYDQTLYTIAPDAQAAKETVHNWLTHKTKSVKRKFQANKKYMSYRIKEVNNWENLLELIQYLANQRMNNNDRLTHLGEREYKILLDKIQQPNFFHDIAVLTTKERTFLKTIFKHISTTHKIPENIKQAIKKLGPKTIQTELFPEPEKQPQKNTNYWSVYTPKKIESRDKLFRSIEGTTRVKDVIKLARRFGISYKALNDYYLMEYHNQISRNANNYYQEDQAAYLHKWLRQKMGEHRWHKQYVQEGDYRSEKFAWDSIMRMLGGSGIDHPLVYAVTNSSYSDQADNRHYNDVADRLYSFYQAGPPEVTPIATRLYETLQEMVYLQHEYEQGQEEIKNKAVGYDYDNYDDYDF